MPVGLAPTSRSDFQAQQLETDILEKSPIIALPFHEGVFLRGYDVIRQPNCQVIFEDWMPGGPEFTWVFTHDEFQIGISGAAEIEVHLPPLYSSAKKVRVSAGWIYSFPLGARMRVHVLGDQPYRHVCFCPPNPDYPFPNREQVLQKAASG